MSEPTWNGRTYTRLVELLGQNGADNYISFRPDGDATPVVTADVAEALIERVEIAEALARGRLVEMNVAYRHRDEAEKRETAHLARITALEAGLVSAAENIEGTVECETQHACKEDDLDWKFAQGLRRLSEGK